MKNIIKEKGLVVAVFNKILLLYGNEAREIASHNGNITSLAFCYEDLYYGGDFHGVYHIDGNRLNGTNSWTKALFSYKDCLYQAGEPKTTALNSSQEIFFQKDGNEKFFCVHDNNLYVACDNCVCEAFPMGLDTKYYSAPGEILSMASFNGCLYAVGKFKGVWDVFDQKEVVYLYELRETKIEGAYLAIHNNDLYHAYSYGIAKYDVCHLGPKFFNSKVGKNLKNSSATNHLWEIYIKKILSFKDQLLVGGYHLRPNYHPSGRIMDINNDPDSKNPVFSFPYIVNDIIKIPEKYWNKLWKKSRKLESNSKMCLL